VLVAQPHARRGELHGLYETSGRRGEAPPITLWMRSAREKRVVAFLTFLWTLLHEIGHYVDYTLAMARMVTEPAHRLGWPKGDGKDAGCAGRNSSAPTLGAAAGDPEPNLIAGAVNLEGPPDEVSFDTSTDRYLAYGPMSRASAGASTGENSNG